MSLILLTAAILCLILAIPLCFAPNAVLVGLLLCAALVLFFCAVAKAEAEGWTGGAA
jgi:hypothetical protein